MGRYYQEKEFGRLTAVQRQKGIKREGRGREKETASCGCKMPCHRRSEEEALYEEGIECTQCQ